MGTNQKPRAMSKTSLQFFNATRHFLSPHGHSLLNDDTKDESVKAKWEEVQSFETNCFEPKSFETIGEERHRFESHHHGPTTLQGQTVVVDASMSSLTSSGSGSSSDSMTTTSAKIKLGSAKSRWKQMKKGSMRKLSNLTNRLNINNAGKGSKPTNSGNVPKVEDVVNTAPDGRLGHVLPRIQASKSMQNLEQITRDSYYNLRGATATLKDKCNSFVELRQGQLKGNYDELWDEDSDGNEDVDRKQKVILQRIGLY